MGRPFSYSDDNFTVIGNVLFCHIKLTGKISKYDAIVEIPPEIYKRMLYRTNTFVSTGVLDNIAVTGFVNVSVITSSYDEKYYIYVASDVNDSADYLIGYYILEDI